MAKTECDPFETLSDFLEWASQFDDGTYVFRGVPNDRYDIQASAYRRVPENEQNSDDKGFPTFVEINTALIREARLRGYDQKDGRPLGDLEILAGLQHFKAATCLIDFTYSAQVALWFACAQDSKTYDEAIRLNPNDEFIYNQRELVKAQQEQYETET